MYYKRVTSLLLCMLCLVSAFAGCSKGSKSKLKSEDEKVTVTNENNNIGKTEETKFSLKADIKKNVSVPYVASNYEKKVKSYKVNSDLSNIENLKQFGVFSASQKKLLSQNAFVVSPSTEEQLFYIYEKNQYLKIPSFITTDSVLQMYHIFYDYSLRNLEIGKLAAIAKDLTASMLDKSIKIYNNVSDSSVKNAAFKNMAYFGTAALCMGLEMPYGIAPDAKSLAEKEYSLIQKKEGVNQSAIFPFELDYSQFEPRGHYTRSDDLKKYFTVMMWYGLAPFPLYKSKNPEVRNIEQTLQALLVTYSLFLDKEGTSDIELWEKIYEPTTFYVGKSDDLTVYDYKDMLLKVYGESPDINKLSEKLDKVYEEAEKLPEPNIKAKYTEVTTPVGKQFRFMGQRYIPDSEIIQEVVEPIERPVPSGLDVMGVLGSDRAYEIQLSKKENEWKGYPELFKKMKEKFAKLPDETWRSNMYYGWLWVLKSFTVSFGEGYPSFMTNKAWTDKSLSTALGSWSELRHDTVLYGKQSGAEKGGGEEPEILGYVEPSVEVYDKLLWLTTYSKENLSARGLLDEKIKDHIERFENLLEFLRDCSIKELKGEELTREEYFRIFDYGQYMEWMTSSLATDGLRWFEIESEADKNMALITDFHTIAPNNFYIGGYMEAGVGPAHEIYVVVPINGKLYLTRGAVFSFYEFESQKRLTDEEWQKMLKNNSAPRQPSWTSTFISGGKGKIPEPENPYNS